LYAWSFRAKTAVEITKFAEATSVVGAVFVKRSFSFVFGRKAVCAEVGAEEVGIGPAAGRMVRFE
jgi:hypothetical protein